MNKMNELFVDTINKAMLNADLVGDKYQKSMAYASTAQALAIYLSGKDVITPLETKEDKKSNKKTKTDKIAVAEDDVKISDKNKEILEKMDKAIKSVDEKKEELIAKWQLKFDKEGIPFLDEEDFAIPERVLAYENAYNTPEVQAIVRGREIAAGQKVLNEMNEGMNKVFKDAVPQQKSAQFSEDELNSLELHKTSFGYEADPSVLDNMFLNFTDGAKKTLAELTPELLNPFLLFIKEEIAKAYEEVEGWKASWITKEGLDGLISQAYGVEGATLEEYLHDGNVQWFVGYIRLYNANAYYQGWYDGQIDRASLDAYIRECFEDSEMNADSINDSNVIVIYTYISSMMAQTA